MSKWLARGGGVVCSVVVVRLLAYAWSWPAAALYDGDPAAQRALVRGADRWVHRELGHDDFSTGSARYDGEWRLVSRMMAILGYAQVAHQHPEQAAAVRPAVEASLRDLVRAGQFDRDAWGEDALEHLGSNRAHVGYLGYMALGLAAAETVAPESPEVARLPEIIAHLLPLFERSPIGLLETYPGEIYPIDNTAFLGALALHDRASGENHERFLSERFADLRRRYRDPHTGLLIQSVAPDGTQVDGPRASGTALAAYFSSFADRAFSAELYAALRATQLHRTLGFGTVSEYPPGDDGWGDVDSGPVILGQGVSATGFTLGLARIHRDRETYLAIWATASAVGVPVSVGERRHFAFGGPLGDTLLFALATAGPLTQGAS